jgi:hypothetical protein
VQHGDKLENKEGKLIGDKYYSGTVTEFSVAVNQDT